ncbi:MAG TPA: aminotransferase class V-fold PLP-dependent enzyme [bacterium]|nr:aminotransferase class V-fold PLP-dependent enzyme [bacterium]
MTETQLKAIRELFPVTHRYAYLNHASNGSLALPVVAAMNGYIERCSLHGEVPYSEAEAAVEEGRELAARLMGVRKEEIAFVKNTSAGAIIAIGSIDWHHGDNMILMRDAFPTNIYPFNYLLPFVEKRYVTSTELAKGSDCIFRLVDRHTRAIAIDWVHFLSGVRADIGAISDFCRTRAIHVLLDAMQGLGAVDQSFGDLGFDFVYAGGGKWLLGPQGSGILYVNSATLPGLKPANLGWLSARWDDFNDIYTPKPMKPGASRFEEGTKNYIGIYGLRESLRILLNVGMSEVAARVRMHVQLLRQWLNEKGFETLTPAVPERHAGVIDAYRPGVDMAALFARLKEQGFICSLRENRLRIAPHFYNTEEEVERFCAALPGKGETVA